MQSEMPLVLWRMGLGPLIGQVYMLITTTGRRSGLPRRSLEDYFFVNGKKYLYADQDAQWYQNARVDPQVTIQTAYGTERVTVRPVSDPDEMTKVFVALMHNRPRLAERIFRQVGIQNIPEDLIANAERLALVTFEPTGEPTPPPLELDLLWALPAAFAGWLILRSIARPRRRR